MEIESWLNVYQGNYMESTKWNGSYDSNYIILLCNTNHNGNHVK